MDYQYIYAYMTNINAFRAMMMIGYLSVILYLGFRRRTGFASWHMFAGIVNCSFDLTRANGETLNPWDYLPHTHLSMTRSEAELFLLFLCKLHGISDLSGRVVIRNNHRLTIVGVVNSELAGGAP